LTDKLRVLIADDHTIVRSGVRLLLEAEPNITVVGEALDGCEAVSIAEALHPDVVLMDIAMPNMDGMEATRQLKSRWPDIRVLVLTMHRSDEYFFEMLRNGASGYVLKGANPSELIEAVQIVGRGEVYLYPTMAKELLKVYLSQLEGSSEFGHRLSARENEILRLLAHGYTNKEIAEKLVISPSTTYTHYGNLMKKLKLSNRRELIQYAREHGLLH
jgi:two-component system response regulator NreC